MNRTKILGAYLLVAGIVQASLYLAMSLPGDHLWLMYFDPRLWIFFLEVTLKGPDLVTPWIFSWMSALWLIFLGGLIIFGHAWIKTYIISEILLSLPNVLLAIGVIWANMNPAHGFSIGELLFPVLVMLPFTIVPLTLAFWSRRQSPGRASDNPVRA